MIAPFFCAYNRKAQFLINRYDTLDYIISNKILIIKNMAKSKIKKELLNLANAGDCESQYDLAFHYENAGDYEKAFYWFNKCADKGFVPGINAIAMYYKEGLFVQQDYKKAFNLFSSIMNELPPAKCTVGTMYLEGDGCAMDAKKGLQLYEEAANEGCGLAALMLGQTYLEGLCSTPINYKKAAMWFEKAYQLEEYESVMYLKDIYAGVYSRGMKDKSKHEHWLDIETELTTSGVYNNFQNLPVQHHHVNSNCTLEWLQEKSGRYHMILDGNIIYRDELLAQNFLINPNLSIYTVVEHIDGDLSNDDLNNLRWVKK